MAIDVVDRCLNGSDFLSFFVWNFSIKLFFQSHYQLNGVKRISTQVFNERCRVSYFVLFHTQLLSNDFLNALFDIAHTI